MKLTLAEKLENVKRHLYDDVPIYEIKNKYGQDPSSLKYCIVLYKRYGDKAFKTELQRKKYSRELKLNVIHEHIVEGKSLRSIALDLMLTDPRIVADWVEKYKKHGEESIQDTYPREAYKRHDDKILEKEYKKLLEDLQRTKAENEYLKKSFPQVLKRSRQLKKK